MQDALTHPQNPSHLLLLEFVCFLGLYTTYPLNILTWTSQSQTGVNKLQISIYKTQINFKLQCSSYIPLPEAKDYIQKKESKQKELKQPGKSSFSLEKSNLEPHDLKNQIVESLSRPSDLTPPPLDFVLSLS